MKYRESEEMYLETILLIGKRTADVHAVDVAAELGHAKSSTSRAMKLLSEKGYITVAHTGEITLTETGRAKASAIYERHRVITGLLVAAGADKALAEENACRIEHVISDELFDVLKKFSESQDDKRI